ncbi:MAG: 4Fe-4S binding protein, partial [Polyangiaceae bacterium]
MTSAAPGNQHHHDEVAPIPWLGKVGEVDPLDRAIVRVGASDVAPSDVQAAARYSASLAAGLARVEATPVMDRDARASSVEAPVKKGCGSGSCGCASNGTATNGAGKKESSALQANGASSAMTANAAGAVASVAASAAIASAPPKGPAKPKKIDPKRPGSGIPARRSIRTLVWVRRVVQVSSLALFTFLLVETTFRGSFAAKADTVVRMPYPVEGFLLADPFVAAMTFLATHTIYRGLLWSVALLALTLVFGRVFCGWICPFGTLHHFFAWILPSPHGRGSSRINANHTHGYQRVKYYLLYAFLAAALAGSAIGGLFDPICICVRAIGLAVLPAVQYIGGHGLAAAASVNERHVQFAADSAQDFLARSVGSS